MRDCGEDKQDDVMLFCIDPAAVVPQVVTDLRVRGPD